MTTFPDSLRLVEGAGVAPFDSSASVISCSPEKPTPMLQAMYGEWA